MNLKRNDITVDLLKTELEQADLMRQYEAEIEQDKVSYTTK